MRAAVQVLVILLAAAACKGGGSSGSQPGSGSAKPVATGDANLQAAVSIDAGPPDAAAPEPDSSYRWFRIEATVDKLGRVPWIVGVHRDRPEGVVWSADERLPLVVRKRDPLQLRIPIRGIELDFNAPETATRLEGTWLVSYYYKRDFPIVAVPVDAPSATALYPGDQAPALDMNGAWSFDIKEFGVGRATFRQDAQGVVVGTIIPPEIGDMRHLTGRVIGNRVQLQAFDGIHGFHLEMTSKDAGKTLAGTWLIAGIGKMSFKANRAAPPDTHVKVSAHMKPGKTTVSLPQLDEPPYKGKPVIVDYFGSWCPVCIDLTPELVRMQRENAASGLQVLSIALEPPGDEVEARRRLDEFRAQFGMTWPFHITYTDDFNGAVAPEVAEALGFPVTIFLRADHTVAAVHTGFVSKAAGPDREAAIKLLESYVQQIVAAKPASP